MKENEKNVTCATARGGGREKVYFWKGISGKESAAGRYQNMYETNSSSILEWYMGGEEFNLLKKLHSISARCFDFILSFSRRVSMMAFRKRFFIYSHRNRKKRANKTNNNNRNNLYAALFPVRLRFHIWKHKIAEMEDMSRGIRGEICMQILSVYLLFIRPSPCSGGAKQEKSAEYNGKAIAVNNNTEQVPRQHWFPFWTPRRVWRKEEMFFRLP